MPLDPQLRAMLDRAPAGVSLSELPPPVARAGFQASVLASLGENYEPLPLEVRDHTIASLPPADREHGTGEVSPDVRDHGIPVRIYRAGAGAKSPRRTAAARPSAHRRACR